MGSKDVYAGHLKAFLDKKMDADDFDTYGSAKDIYIKEVFKSYTALTSQLELLEVMPLYFGNIDAMEAMKKAGVKEIDYYKYHYETFIIRIVSVLDLCSKLGNYTYELGIRPIDCNWSRVRKELGVNDTSNRLVGLKNHLTDFTKDRNIIIHQGNHQTKEVESIDSKIYSLEMIEIEAILQEWFDKEKDEKIAEVKQNMENTIKTTIDLAFEFIESLKEAFEKKL